MKHIYILAAMAAIVFISGCIQEGTVGNQTPAAGSISVDIVSAPTTATAGVPFTITWTVSGPVETIQHTAVHYDYVSHPGTLGEDVGPPGGYAYLTTEFASGSFNIPNTFSVNITPTETGILYFRAHAIANGKNYWTDERSIYVGMPAESQIREFAFSADDSGFYYANNTPVYFVSVNKGDFVKMTLNVKPANLARGSLDFRGCGQNATGIMPGNPVNMQFYAASSCAISSYWPSSAVVKSAVEIIATQTPTSTVYGSTNSGKNTSNG